MKTLQDGKTLIYAVDKEALGILILSGQGKEKWRTVAMESLYEEIFSVSPQAVDDI